MIKLHGPISESAIRELKMGDEVAISVLIFSDVDSSEI